MSSFFAKFKAYIHDKYVMPYSLKKSITKTNLKRTKILLPLLLVYGVIFLLFIIIFKPAQLNYFYHLFYYISIIVLSSISLLLLFVLKKKQAKLSFQIFPMYFLLVWLLSLCLVAIYMEDGSVNALLSLYCLIVVVLALLYIEPLMFIGTGLIINAPIVIKFFLNEDTLSAINFTILYCIFDAISLFRWSSLKSELLHERFITQQNKKLEVEIELAGLVQQNFYKHQDSVLKNWTVGYYFSPMLGVSGDLFDFYVTDSELDGFGIFDISGHGLSSALLTMLVKNILLTEFYNNENEFLEEKLYKANERIIEEKGNVENYLTGILAQVKKDSLEFIVAGHPAPIIFKNKKNETFYHTVEHENKPSVIGMRGIMPSYTIEKLSVSKNDQIVLYTDGILEIKNAEGEEFGKERLLNFVAKNALKSVDRQIELLKQEILSFQGDASQTDDVTFVILKKK